MTAAGQQNEPQRLLFVFLQASLSPGSNTAQIDSYEDGEGGQLYPMMYVDKTIDELSDFSELVTESEQLCEDWHIVIVAALSGLDGIAPSSEEAEEPLQLMVETVKKGGDLSGFVAFNKNGDVVQFA